ncbi:hypothetical protein ACQY0O_001474 [Thecaphora frezii]
MLGLMQWLLLALLAVQAAYGASGTTTWHLVHNQREIRQCKNAGRDLTMAYSRNSACDSIVQSGPNDMGCVNNGRTQAVIMNRFVLACDRAGGRLADAPSGKIEIFYFSRPRFAACECSDPHADLVYSRFSLNTKLSCAPAQVYSNYSTMACSTCDGFEAACTKASGLFGKES